MSEIGDQQPQRGMIAIKHPKRRGNPTALSFPPASLRHLGGEGNRAENDTH